MPIRHLYIHKSASFPSEYNISSSSIFGGASASSLYDLNVTEAAGNFRQIAPPARDLKVISPYKPPINERLVNVENRLTYIDSDIRDLKSSADLKIKHFEMNDVYEVHKAIDKLNRKIDMVASDFRVVSRLAKVAIFLSVSAIGFQVVQLIMGLFQGG